MDPQATFDELLDAVSDRDWDRMDDLSEALLRWMETGGFPPRTVGLATLGRNWHRSTATFICHLAQSHVRDARRRECRPGDGPGVAVED
jgi:hypothetical protein